MRSFLLAGTCAASILLAVSSVQAADIDYVPEPQGWEWYVSVLAGWSNPDGIDGTTGGGYYYDLDLDDGFVAGIALGAHINEWVRAEVEVSGHWHDVDGTVYPFDTVEGDADAMFALANLWIDLPLSEIVRPYFGGGVGLGRLDLDIEWTTGDTAFDDSDWGFAYQLGAGVALNITDNIALDFGYRYKVINNAEVEMEQNGEDVEVDYQSHNFIAGIRLEM